MSMALREIRFERCFHHAHREAVGRCTGCSRCFCRECVTDVEGKLLCASCIEARLPQSPPPSGRAAMMLRTLQALAAVIVMWLLFYFIGAGFLSLPSDWHN